MLSKYRGYDTLLYEFHNYNVQNTYAYILNLNFVSQYSEPVPGFVFSSHLTENKCMWVI